MILIIALSTPPFATKNSLAKKWRVQSDTELFPPTSTQRAGSCKKSWLYTKESTKWQPVCDYCVSLPHSPSSSATAISTSLEVATTASTSARPTETTPTGCSTHRWGSARRGKESRDLERGEIEDGKLRSPTLTKALASYKLNEY